MHFGQNDTLRRSNAESAEKSAVLNQSGHLKEICKRVSLAKFVLENTVSKNMLLLSARNELIVIFK